MIIRTIAPRASTEKKVRKVSVPVDETLKAVRKEAIQVIPEVMRESVSITTRFFVMIILITEARRMEMRRRMDIGLIFEVIH